MALARTQDPNCMAQVVRLLAVSAALTNSAVALADDLKSQPAAETRPERIIDLVLTQWLHANYITPKEVRCPNGINTNNKTNWRVQFPTEKQQAEAIHRFLYLGPLQGGGPVPEFFYMNRGPNGESVLYNPGLVRDPAWRETQGTVAYGFNLTGETTGVATATSVKHQKFTSPDGEPGIDNQLFRIFGCMTLFEDGNGVYYNIQTRTDPRNRVLMRISDVDDEKNDPHVKVSIYRGIDGMVQDASGTPVPWQPQRIDTRFPRYSAQTTGKIVNGVLYTDPVDARFYTRRITTEGERFLRSMRFKLTLTDTGAIGLLGGYENLKEYWRLWRNSEAQTVDQGDTQWDPPAFWEALNRLADGFPDPKTGKATAISAAYKVGFVRANIVDPVQEDPVRTEAVMKAVRASLTQPSLKVATDRSTGARNADQGPT